MSNPSSIKTWARGFIVFLFFLAVDFLSKKWALSSKADIPMGIFGIDFSHLKFAFLEITQKNVVLKMINYVTLLGPLLLLYFFFSFHFLSIEKLKNLNLFLGIWMAGIVGNILDRVFYGTVIDFMVLRIGSNIFFNLATLLVITGAIGFFYQLYLNRGNYVFSNQRKLRLHYAGLQYDYVFKILLICLFLCVTIALFSYAFIKFYLVEYGVSMSVEILHLYLVQILIISVLYLFIIVMVGFHFSNQYAGPLHGFEKYIERLEQGDLDATFNVRENDHLRLLEGIADKIKKHWKP